MAAKAPMAIPAIAPPESPLLSLGVLGGLGFPEVSTGILGPGVICEPGGVVPGRAGVEEAAGVVLIVVMTAGLT